MSHEFVPDIKQSPKFDLLKLTPEKPISPIPVLVAPGFGTGAQIHKLLIERLYFNGFVTISPDYKYGHEPKKWLFFPDVDAAKQQALLATIEAEGYLNEQGIRQVNVVAHSKGAYDIAMVALEHPENFRNIIMVAPGGLRPKMDFLKSIKTMKEDDRKDKEDKVRLIKTAEPEVAKLVLENNVYGKNYKKNKIRYNLEGLTSATKSMEKYLPEVRKKRIKIVIIAQINDPMYPPSSFSSFVKGNVDEFIELSGIHGEIKYRPDGGQFVSNLLKKLEKLS